LSKFARKRKHINYMYDTINKLHSDIFNSAFELVNFTEVSSCDREKLKTKITLYRKYNRRLRLLEL